MKLQTKIFVTLILFIFSIFNINAQSSLTLQVFEPLPQIDFAAFATSNDLTGMPRIFFVQINPKGAQVAFKGVVQWKQNESSGFEQLFSFTTEVFSARDFYNDDVGNDIVIKTTSSNSDLVSTNIKLGKPTGTYKLIGILLDENGNQLATDTKVLEFVNPAQTLTLLSPEPKSTQDAFSVMASWSEVNGAGSYTVLANVRKDRTEGLEESLKSGSLYVNKNVGLTTVVNLSSIREREWLPGDEIVMQVVANIPGPNGGSEIESNIINFYLNSFTPDKAQVIEKKFIDIASILGGQLGSDFWNKVANGEISIKNIRKPDGSPLTYEEISALLNYIKLNPDLVISMKKL